MAGQGLGGQAVGGRRPRAGRLGRPPVVLGRPAGRRPRRGRGPAGWSTGWPAAGPPAAGPSGPGAPATWPPAAGRPGAGPSSPGRRELGRQELGGDRLDGQELGVAPLDGRRLGAGRPGAENRGAERARPGAGTARPGGDEPKGGMTLRGLPPRLRWFIVLVATAGLLASVAVVLLEPGRWDRSVWPRLAALLVLTAASEIAGPAPPPPGRPGDAEPVRGHGGGQHRPAPGRPGHRRVPGRAAGGPGGAAPGPGQGGLQPRHVRHRPGPGDRRLPPGGRGRRACSGAAR